MKLFLFTLSILAITTLRRWCVLVDCSLSLAASLYARSAASWATPDDPQKITFAEMLNMNMRRGMLLCLLLSACSSDKIDVPPVVYVPPSPPTQDAVITGLKAAASEAKLTAPLEVSTVRPTDHGPGRFFACLKGTMLPSPTPKAAADDSGREPSILYQTPLSGTEPRVAYYSVFFDNDVYKGTRQSVIMEACEAQQFTPVDLSLPPAPPKSPPKRK